MVNEQWDGRPSFYPAIGYEMDQVQHALYLEFCEKEGLAHLFEESSDNPDDSCEDSTESEVSPSGLSYDIIYSPHLYDRKDHYHELYPIDEAKYRCFVISDSGKGLQTQMEFRQRMLKEEKWSSKIVKQATELIVKNRKETASIKIARTSLVILNARITGLAAGSPTRRIEVHWKIPLATLHDRVLCPVFGWTRGYHDYRFAMPPSGYQHSPPKIPMLDIVFGAQSKDSLITPFAKFWFYGTLRNGDGGAPTICDNAICVADLLHLPGHRLWHVLGQPGWKTELTVEEIVSDIDEIKPALLGGQVGNLPESFDLGLGEEDFGGTHAFALAHEMIQQEGSKSNEAVWMKRHVLQNGSVKQSDFDLDRKFDLEAARSRLSKAWKGESTPNPEYSANWMFNMFGPDSMMRSPDESMQQAGVCNFCRRTGETLKVEKMKHCARCKNVNYCSRECQKKDWKTHKKSLSRPKKGKDSWYIYLEERDSSHE